jgi:ligand-binding sensor domain-containing protein
MNRVFIFIAIAFPLIFWNCNDKNPSSGEWKKSPTEGIKGCKVHHISMDQWGNKWFATNKGLVGYNDKEWTLLTKSNDDSKNNINWVYVNNLKDLTELWMATYQGIAVIQLNDKLEIEHSFSYTREKDGLPSDSISRIMKGSDEGLWAMTEKGTSYFKDKWTTQINNRLITAIPAKSGWFSSKDENFLGRRQKGMIRFRYDSIDAITGASEWTAPYNGIILDTVNFIYKSSAGALWLACLGNSEYTGPSFPKDGLIKHVGDDPKTGNTYFNNLYGGLVNNRVNYIAESQGGVIWLATEGGISYQLNDTLFGNYTANEGLAHNVVHSLAFDLDGSLWCGTENGISHFNNGVFTNYLNH